MSDDARFEDGDEAPLRLLAQDSDDLAVVSALVQDAVAQTSEMVFERPKMRFTLLLNRFRWEDADAAANRVRPFERVQSLLSFGGVTRVSTHDIDPRDKDLVLALMQVAFESGDPPGGRIILHFSGDGSIALDAECLEVQLKDVSRPYQARAQRQPAHPLD